MRRVFWLALAALLIAPPAATQTPFTSLVMPPRTVLGNTGAQSDFGQAVPFATLTANLTRAALTRVNDTNVTVTLGGSPTTALLDAASLTMGWSGVLANARGGTGVAAGPPIYTITATGVNMNAVADTQFAITLPSGFTRYRLQTLMISHASVSLTTATVVHYGLFTAAAAGGTAVVADTTSTISSTAESTNNNAQFIAPGITATLTDATLFFRVITAHGSAATADVVLQIQPLP